MPKKKAKQKKDRRNQPIRSNRARPVSASEPVGQASLRFYSSVQDEGFSHSSISQFNDRDVPSAVRELIQNSLDAAMGIDRPAVVRFVVERMSLASVPGLSGYKSAFESARKRIKKGDDRAAGIAEDIAGALAEKEIPFLFVEDNGVGLDSLRMSALLGDGVSVKEGEKNIGSYGNGHLTVFCLSRLRYVLYGGVQGDGSITASGHAILATHTDNQLCRLSKDGFYAVSISTKDDNPFVYPQNDQTPPVLKKRLDAVRQEFQSGSVVAVPGFNFFGREENDKIAESVIKVAALNFFPAIEDGNLEIRVLENGNEVSLTKGNLAEHIAQYADDNRRLSVGFPTGLKAAAAYRTLTGDEKTEHSAPVSGGAVRLLLRQGESVKATRVVFCRNGMWVTDRVNMLAKSHFANKVPFDALFLVDIKNGGDFHNLMSQTEGRLHIDLSSNRLDKPLDKKAWHKSFSDLREFLRQQVDDSESDFFEPDDFYRIETGKSIGGSRSSIVMRGTAKPVPGTLPFLPGDKSKKTSSAKNAARTRTGGKTMPVKIMSRRKGGDKFSICVAFLEDCDNCELQMALDNGADPSCTGMLDSTRLYLQSAKVGNETLILTGSPDKPVGVVLGGARQGDRRVLDVEFAPGQLRESSLQTIACAFYRRAKKGAQGGAPTQSQ